MANKDVKITISANDKASRGIANTSKRLKNLGTQSKQSASQVKDAGNNMKGAFNKIALAAAWAFAIDQAIKFGSEMLKLATDIEQLDKKSAIVFGDFEQGVKDVANEVANSMGLTTNEFVWAAAGIADILVPLWFAREQAAEMSTELTTLSWALAEWSNWQYTATQTAEILQKAMVWEVEQLKTMWIVVDQSSKQYNERIKQIMATTWVTQAQAKAQDIQRQIMEKSTDAQTAFKEWGDSLARTQAETTAKIRELKDTMARALSPQISEIVWKITDQITKRTENEKVMNTTIEVLKYLGDVILVTIDFIGLMVEWVSNIIDRLDQLRAFISQYFPRIEQFATTMKDTVVGAFDSMKDAVGSVIDWLGSKIDTVMSIVNRIKSAVSSVRNIWWWDTDGARQFGWPVKAWNSYLVGENWPEVFTPWSSGIINNTPTSNSTSNQNNFNITVNNAQDESRLVSLIENTLYKWQRNLSLWIS